jgi:hypothetical protein
MDTYTHFPIKEIWKIHKSYIAVKVNQTVRATGWYLIGTPNLKL